MALGEATCRRLDINRRAYLWNVLPKLGQWPSNQVGEVDTRRLESCASQPILTGSQLTRHAHSRRHGVSDLDTLFQLQRRLAEGRAGRSLPHYWLECVVTAGNTQHHDLQLLTNQLRS